MRRPQGLRVLLLLPALGLGAPLATPPDYPPAIPPDAIVREALDSAPRIAAAREQVSIGQARERKLRAGSYEWEVAAMSQQRRDGAGNSYAEQQYELSRRWRLPGKAALDRRAGALAVEVGRNSYADAWHEAGRALLAGWFDWLREDRLAELLQRQVQLASGQFDAVERRVAAGDAPRLDADLAQAELGRVVALQLDAQRRAEAARLALVEQFPTLHLQVPQQIGRPVPVEGSDDAWIRRIVAENHEIELARGLAEEAQVAASRARQDRMADPIVGLHFSSNIDQNRQVLGLRVALPIGTAARGAEAALARSNANVAAAELERTRSRVESAARLALLNARSGFLQWDRLSAAASQSRGVADSLARAYAAGELGMTELLAARRQALDAEQLQASAQLTAHEAYARLKLDAHELWSLAEDPDH